MIQRLEVSLQTSVREYSSFRHKGRPQRLTSLISPQVRLPQLQTRSPPVSCPVSRNPQLRSKPSLATFAGSTAARTDRTSARWGISQTIAVATPLRRNRGSVT